MKLLHPCSLLLAALLSSEAQDQLLALEETKPAAQKANRSARDRIPVGAVLTNFSAPRFSEEKRRLSLVTAKSMIVESAEELKGEQIKVWMFDRAEKTRSITEISRAHYHLDQEILIGTGQVTTRDQQDEFYAHSQGGIFNLATSQVLLTGSTQTMFLVPEKKATDPVSMKYQQILPFTSLIPLLTAAAPPEIDPKELIEFERLVAPRLVPEFTGQEDMEEADQRNQTSQLRLAEFLSSTKKYQLLLQAPPIVEEEADPLEQLFEPHPDRIFITASDGVYFDGSSFELIYRGKIRLEGKGVTMTCTKDLNVLFDAPGKEESSEKVTSNQSPQKPQSNQLAGLGGVGALKQLTANGELRISGEKDGQQFHLGGDRAVYDKNKNQIIIRGDKLGCILGENGFRSINKDAYAIINISPDNTIKDIQMSRGDWVTALTVPNDSKTPQ